MSLAVSTAIIGLLCLLGHLLRLLVRRSIRQPQYQNLLQEAIAASELCGCVYELGIIANSHGLVMYAVYLFSVGVYWSLAWGDVYACPYLHVEDWWTGKTRLNSAILKVLAEVAGGWATWRYVRLLWQLQLSPAHQDRWVETCSADLQVTPLHGALVEGGAVLVCRLLARALSDLEPRFATAINSLCGTLLVIVGLNYSGGYYNPMLASALKLGCVGHSVAEHLAVYWGAACLGAIASTHLYPLLQPHLVGTRRKLE